MPESTGVMPFYRISGTLASTRYACRRCTWEIVVDRRHTPWTDRLMQLATHLQAEHNCGPLVKVVA